MEQEERINRIEAVVEKMADNKKRIHVAMASLAESLTTVHKQPVEREEKNQR